MNDRLILHLIIHEARQFSQLIKDKIFNNEISRIYIHSVKETSVDTQIKHIINKRNMNIKFCLHIIN